MPMPIMPNNLAFENPFKELYDFYFNEQEKERKKELIRQSDERIRKLQNELDAEKILFYDDERMKQEMDKMSEYDEPKTIEGKLRKLFDMKRKPFNYEPNYQGDKPNYEIDKQKKLKEKYIYFPNEIAS